MADPYALLGVQPGASKAEVKAAFRRKAMAHHPDMHTTASEAVKAANDAAFKQLNEAYQAIMDGDAHRYARQRGGGASSAGAYGRAGFGRGAYTGSYGGGAYQRPGGYHDPNYNPFEQSSYRPGGGSSYWGWQQFVRRQRMGWQGAFRPFAGLGRGEAAVTAALGLILAGAVLLLEPLAGSLWEANNEGKLYSSIEAEAARKKEQRAAQAAEAAAAAIARQRQAAAAQAAARAAPAHEEGGMRGGAALPAEGAASPQQPQEAAAPLAQVAFASSDVPAG